MGRKGIKTGDLIKCTIQQHYGSDSKAITPKNTICKIMSRSFGNLSKIWELNQSFRVTFQENITAVLKVLNTNSFNSHPQGVTTKQSLITL